MRFDRCVILSVFHAGDIADDQRNNLVDHFTCFRVLEYAFVVA